MPEAEDSLARWVGAGLIDEATAGRIREFEASRARERRSTAPDVPPDERPGTIEVLLYLGIAVLSVGVVALIAQEWAGLDSLGRVLAVGVPALFALLVGALLRTLDEPGYLRGAQFSWAAAVALVAATVAVILYEYQPGGFSRQDDHVLMLVVAVAASGLALLLWSLNPMTFQVLAIGGSLFFFGQAIGNWPAEQSNPLAGGTLLAVALTGILLTETGRFGPRDASRYTFGLLLALGAFQPGFQDGGTPWEIPAFVVAAALLGLGVRRGSFAYVLWGVALLFLALVRTIYQNFSDEIGAPVALIISGALLIGAVLILARLAPSFRGARTP
jgi:hypothetical protein